jgi:hypothetical protein
LQYSVLHGAGAVANALSVGDMATNFDRFQVDVAALIQPEDNFGLPERNRSARMIWNEVNVPSPQLEIYVQTKMLRHLIELYVTKRIDAILMSMKIEVERQAIINTSVDFELLPLLDKDGHLYFRRTQCELLSVTEQFSLSLPAGGSLLSRGQTIILGVPEPSTWAMMVLGFAGLGLLAHMRRRKTSPA